MILNKLTEDIPKNQGSDSPAVITIIEKCIRYQIPYGLMCDLNYRDLKYLIINRDIEMLNELNERLAKQSDSSRGIIRQKMSDEAFISSIK